MKLFAWFDNCDQKVFNILKTGCTAYTLLQGGWNGLIVPAFKNVQIPQISMSAKPVVKQTNIGKLPPGCVKLKGNIYCRNS
jgi:hypothetical protein